MSENKHTASSTFAAAPTIGLLDLPWALRLVVILFHVNITLVPSIVGIAMAELLWQIWRWR